MVSKHVKLLDCTLRDGGYLIDKKFGNANIKGIIKGLVEAKIDCIEIGFFQNEGFGNGKTVYLNSKDAKKYVPKDKEGKIFTVLADCSRYSIANLDECDGTSIDAIRECFFKNELAEAMENCRTIKKKGYKCFVQPVDILGYSDEEILNLIESVNDIEPYCLSIVDTFGSMYIDDLHRVFEIINHNLVSSCKIGFHSHNNMQMSNALSQEFVNMALGKREVIIDGTLSGMGRGAGNTPTELIAQYLVTKYGYYYDIDAILDILDGYMNNIRTMCSWGYSIPCFIAGCYGAHVNNVAYLTQKNSIHSKDLRFILNKIGEKARKRYDYDLLENTYLEYIQSDIDDSNVMKSLKGEFDGKEVLILIPGKSISEQKAKIINYIEENNPILIGVNFIEEGIHFDYIYMSNKRRYSYWKDNAEFRNISKIIASNIKSKAENDKEYIVSFSKIIKCGFEHFDNSGLMLLRLLDMFSISKISIAGFDGHSCRSDEMQNYVFSDLETEIIDASKLNQEIEEMLIDYNHSLKIKCEVEFITNSRFKKVFA